HGYRGTGMELVYNPRTLASQIPANQMPEPAPEASADGPKANQIYKNVPVLGHLSIAQFNRQMAAITQWVAPPEVGCNYCHIAENFADDSKYTKVVSRRMLQMTQHINADWKDHVKETGVTCYTCHRGNAVPANVWFTAQPQDKRADFIGNLNGQNQAAKTVGLSSLPYDPFTPYLSGAEPIRVNGTTALPTGHVASIQATEATYGLMMHMSTSLGVNCTFCHNSGQGFASWEGPPQRATAWYGIRMARDLNNEYLEPLTQTFPAHRLGPTGDVAKINCSTCHQGAYKPLFGAQMARHYPELQVVSGARPVVSAPPDLPPLPPPVVEARRSVLYFDVGAAVLHGEQARGLDALVASMAADKAAKARISGYHSASGTLAANQELAKQRAFSVRDAMLAAGIAESRVVLARPVQTAANVAGEDHDARRVVVVVGR
ncbi:MAG TPA: photosynthetic reaction center cytochrome PufC, partial [Rubrivivax sp.]|nr:photosynthetic reaction center cytochrome PufC [Rubrivivax sp.]